MQNKWLISVGILLFCFFGFIASAQQSIHLIKPGDTGNGIYTVHTEHYAVTPADKAIGRLVITIPGTNVKATSFKSFDSVAAALGFHAVSIDYPNKVGTPTFAKSKDPLAFDKFRQEVIFGTPLSDSVAVDSVNCLYNRIVKLVIYLSVNHPAEGWGQFLNGETLNWDKVVLCGHSQGAGAAACLAMRFPVNKVILLAGPQDFSSVYHSPAKWIYGKSATPKDRYRALLHQNDPNNIKNQLACFYMITGLTDGDIFHTSTEAPASAKVRLAVTNLESKNPHGSVTTKNFNNIWMYFLNN